MNLSGETSSHDASEYSHESVVRALIGFSANIHAKELHELVQKNVFYFFFLQFLLEKILS